jgi:hypothetical protein
MGCRLTGALAALSLAGVAAGCAPAPAPSVSPTQSLTAACLAVSSVTVRSLGPPSPRPALVIVGGVATGRTGTYIGDAYRYPVATLTGVDWHQLQREACGEQTYYGLGATTIDSGNGVGGQVFIDIVSTQGKTDLSFGGPNDSSADPLIRALRDVTTKYFGAVTF